jgi:hypothetical protein
VSDKTVLIVGVVLGFVLVPPLARANATLVNGFLFLVLFSSLLYNRERWLPYFTQFTNAAARTQKKESTSSGVLHNGAN